MSKNQEAFFALLQAGLWEKDVRLLPFGDIDLNEVQKLAEEQSVTGLIAAGLDHVQDIKLPKKYVFQIIGQTIQLEERNKAMNLFIQFLIDKMCEEGIYTLLVKGQGVAQCYERPLWRSSGDVDFLLDEVNYNKAKAFLTPLASSVDHEGAYSHHLGMAIDTWVVELHGTMRCGLASRIDRMLDEIQYDAFCCGNVRSWLNGKTQVYLPGVDCDVLFVFTHLLKHFYIGGLGIRQICDWCRILWTYRNDVKVPLLEKRLQKMGLLNEWKAFGAFAVEYLGMPSEAMPLLDISGKKYGVRIKQAGRIKDFVMEVGNFGHNRDNSYFKKYPFVIRKACSLGRRFGDMVHHARILPLDSLRFFPKIVINGLRAAVRGE